MKNSPGLIIRLATFLAALLLLETIHARQKIIVQFEDNVSLQEQQTILRNALENPRSLKSNRNEDHHGRRINSLKKIMVGQVPANKTVEQAIQECKNHPKIKHAEKNDVYRFDAVIPNDPDYPNQWSLVDQINPPAHIPFGWDIDAPEAWEITTGHPDIVVAIIDTGVNYRHPDLEDNMWVNQAEQNGIRGVDDDGNGFVDDIHGYNFSQCDYEDRGVCIYPNERNGDPRDGNGHGTHVAGIVGAVGNNGVGIAGVAWDVKLMAVKAAGSNGLFYKEDSIASIQYAVENGADILNLSWGGGTHSQILEDVINEAHAAGVLIIASAGNLSPNEPVDLHFPGSLENVIGVASTGQSNGRDFLSKWGEWVDVAAPGASIRSTYLGHGYFNMTGTSMATPHVSGLAVLLLSTDLTQTNHQLRERIIKGVDPIDTSQPIGSGRINARLALLHYDNPPPTSNMSEEMTVTLGDNISLTVEASDPNDDPLTYEAFQLPDGAEFNPITQEFTWTPTASNQVRDHKAIFWISDGLTTLQKVVTITVREVSAKFRFSQEDYVVEEDRGPFIFTVIKEGGLSQAHEITVETIDNTAVAGTHYDHTVTTLRWEVGEEGPKTGSVPITNNDFHNTLDKIFFVELKNPTSGTIVGVSNKKVDLLDDELINKFKLIEEEIIVSESDEILIPVERIGPGFGFKHINYRTFIEEFPAAALNQDIKNRVGELRWETAELGTKYIRIPTVRDDYTEPNEIFFVELVPTDLKQRPIGFERTRIFITDPAKIGFEFSTTDITESKGSVDIRVKRYGDDSNPITVRVESNDQTATAGDDYQGISQQISWTAGNSQPVPISVPITSGDEIENVESFEIKIVSSDPNILGEIPIHTVYLIDEEGLPIFRILDFENSAGEDKKAFASVRRLGNIKEQVTLIYEAVEFPETIFVPATVDQDFVGGQKTLTWPANQDGRKLLQTDLITNGGDSSNEEFKFILHPSSDQSYEIIGPDSAPFKILLNDNEDQKPYAIAGPDQTIYVQPGDNQIDAADAQVVFNAWGSSPGDHTWNEYADLVKDGIIDAADVGVLLNAFNATPGHPRWNAEADINLPDKVDVELDGSQSVDAEGEITEYLWIDDNTAFLYYYGPDAFSTTSLPIGFDKDIRLRTKDENENQNERFHDGTDTVRIKVLVQPLESAQFLAQAAQASPTISDEDSYLVVDAGNDQEIGLETREGNRTIGLTQLQGRVFGEFYYSELVELEWLLKNCEGSACGKASFAPNEKAISPSVSFNRPGVYTLKLSAKLGPIEKSDEVTVTVGHRGFHNDENDRIPIIDQPLGSIDSDFIPVKTMFNPEKEVGELKLKLSKSDFVSINIYNRNGTLIQSLGNAIFPAGVHTFQWDGKSQSQNQVSSSHYPVRAKVGQKLIETGFVVIR